MFVFFLPPPFFSTEQRRLLAKYSVHTPPSFNPLRPSILHLPSFIYGLPMRVEFRRLDRRGFEIPQPPKLQSCHDHLTFGSPIHRFC
jgi:hypothetical protein